MISRKTINFCDDYVATGHLLVKDIRIPLLPNRAGNNKIITPKEVKNSFPRGRRPQGEEFFTSCGVIILLLPARLGKSGILTFFTNKRNYREIIEIMSRGR